MSLLFLHRRSEVGVPLKNSLEGYGEVKLNPGETTEAHSTSIPLLEGENFDEVIQKVFVRYVVGGDSKIRYHGLWEGSIEAAGKKVKSTKMKAVNPSERKHK
jgi:hypothetical protein